MALPTALTARSRGVGVGICGLIGYHDLDYVLNTNVMQGPCQITGVTNNNRTTIGDRLIQARKEAGLTQAALAKRAGVSQSTIGNFEAGRGQVPRQLLEIAAAVGVSPAWLKSGKLPKAPLNIGHAVVVNGYTVPSRLLEWGQLMTEELPEVFRVALPDDAMAPDARIGWIVEMDRRERPRFGDGVLVRDGTGAAYFRRYRQGRGGGWEAYATNPDFLTLESERDSLTVLAVMQHVLTPRWG